MPHFRRILGPVVAVIAAIALPGCAPQTTSGGRNVSVHASPAASADEGSLSPDIKKILMAGGLNSANPSGPAAIPTKLGSAVPESDPESNQVVTAMAGTSTATSMNGVWQAPAARDTSLDTVGYPAGKVNVSMLDDVLPSVAKFAPPKPAPAARRTVHAPKARAVAERPPPKPQTAQVTTPKVRRF